MSNGFKKGRIKLNAGKVKGIEPCIVDGKFNYYISLCIEKKPFSDVEEKIKLEYFYFFSTASMPVE